MSIFKSIIEKYKEKQARQRELEDDIKIQHRVTEKQKNANERELERYMEEHRQKMIANKLKQLRKGKMQEMWSSNAFANNRFLFKDRCYLGRYY